MSIKEQQHPKISVVIPCYNYGEFLPEAIDSVFAQTFQDFEVIIVDDGSTDSLTQEVLSQIDHPKIRVIRQEHQGAPVARNRAIQEAQGEFIVPLDADDTIAPSYLEKCCSAIAQFPKVGFVYTQRVHFGEESMTVGREYDFDRLLIENYINTNALCRKSDWEKVGGYREDLSCFQDWEFWINFGKHGIFGKLIPEPLYFYRRNPASISAVVSPKHRKEAYRAIMNLHDDLYTFDKIFDINIARQEIINDCHMGEIPMLHGRLHETYQLHAELVNKLVTTEQQLQHLYRSRGWKIISFLHRLRLRLPFINKL